MCWLNYNVLKLGSDKYFESLPTSQLSYNVYKLGSDKYFDISLMEVTNILTFHWCANSSTMLQQRRQRCSQIKIMNRESLSS